MKKYSLTMKCPKCGHDGFELEICSDYEGVALKMKCYEFLEVTCNKCGYNEQCLPLDAKNEEGIVEG